MCCWDMVIGTTQFVHDEVPSLPVRTFIQAGDPVCSFIIQTIFDTPAIIACEAIRLGIRYGDLA